MKCKSEHRGAKKKGKEKKYKKKRKRKRKKKKDSFKRGKKNVTIFLVFGSIYIDDIHAKT